MRLSKPTYFLTFVLVLGLGLGVAYQVPLARGQVADAAALGSPDQPSAAAVRAFWTPARMAAARPAPMPMLTRPTGRPAPAPAATGTPKYVPPVAPGQAATTGAVLGQLGGTGTQPVVTYYTYPYPFSTSGTFPFSLYNGPALGTLGSWPWITNAKVFFQNAGYGGGTFVCSGTVINSGGGGNRRLVWSAGHCVNSGGDGSTNGVWSTNVLVCPAYRDGNSPVGCWASLQLWTLGGWFSSSNFRRDQGVIVTADNAGWRIQDRVGAEGLAWDQNRVQHFIDFGYPAAAPYTGTRLRQCWASTAIDDSPPGPTAGPQTLGIGCDMTGGSSGGGWIINFTMGGGGYTNGLNSYKYTVPAQPLAMYGPFFDVGTENLWNATRGLFP